MLRINYGVFKLSRGSNTILKEPFAIIVEVCPRCGGVRGAAVLVAIPVWVRHGEVSIPVYPIYPMNSGQRGMKSPIIVIL